VWSAVVPVGTTATASLGLTRMLVLRSGKPEGAGWAEESVDVARDYRRLFGDAPRQPRGIALLTDADDTKSAAVGDYTDFRICPAPEQPAARKPTRPAATKPPARAPRPVVSRVEKRTPPVDRPMVAVPAIIPRAPGSPPPTAETVAR